MVRKRVVTPNIYKYIYIYIYIYLSIFLIDKQVIHSPFTNHPLGPPSCFFFSPKKKIAPKQKAMIWYPAWDGVAVNMATDVKKAHEVGMPRNLSLGWVRLVSHHHGNLRYSPNANPPEKEISPEK